jgi:hypothetical protein
MANQIMRSADFIQTIGVCAHIDDTSSSYAAGKALDQMAYLGLSNMRVEAPSKNLATYTALGEHGVKFDVISSTVTSLATQMSYIDSIAPYVSFVEGPNEINTVPISYKGQYGAPAAIAYQQDLYATVHSDPLLRHVSVLPYSLSVGGSVSGYGDVSAYADYGNVHAYASEGVPPYYMLGPTVASITTTPGDQPLMTETGYYTLLDSRSGVTEDVQAKWLMDTLLENSVSGVLKTYTYQLEDGYTNPTSDPENHYGLFTVDGTPKQVATDIHNLTTILADTGANAATFSPGTLDVSITGLSPDYGFKTIFAKSGPSHSSTALPPARPPRSRLGPSRSPWAAATISASTTRRPARRRLPPTRTSPPRRFRSAPLRLSLR